MAEALRRRGHKLVAAIEPEAIQYEASTCSPAELARYMSRVFGWQLLSFMLGEEHPEDQPLDDVFVAESGVQRRLRSAYEATRVLDTAYGSEMARSWFFGKTAVSVEWLPPSSCETRTLNRGSQT